MYRQIVTNPRRPPPELVERFRGVWTSTVSDAMGRHGVMAGTIRPLFHPLQLVGVALTVLNYPNDNITTHRALQLARAGDVLVVDEGTGSDVGAFGHNMSLAARARGVVGFVSSGCIRDARLLREEGFPIFSHGVNPRSAQKNTPGSINVPVQVGGVVVRPGDIVIGDDDGVVVVPLAVAEEIARAATERQRMEHRQAQDIREGRQALEILYGADWATEALKDKMTLVDRQE
ncbi:MAG: 4-carboxy-4-hydroxy-2-oxoadipate aldolase/oxaloacetate decarboxylase [Candidatus Lambdaproteobacteria bacterium]|nr:4-carboxy-4-hydroxy-2-oxoadipate aldolase/oxaloacetate decarboxylase [Candidatus Lambdaproteobacteria bacterium]